MGKALRSLLSADRIGAIADQRPASSGMARTAGAPSPFAAPPLGID